MWYYINKGILSSSIISCASEFFPVLLVAHWLACGGAEEKAEDIERRRQMRQGVRATKKSLLWFFWIAVPVSSIACTVRWLVYFYWTIDFDHLMEIHWLTNDYVSLVADILQLILFTVLYMFARSLSNDRLMPHTKLMLEDDISILVFVAARHSLSSLSCNQLEVEFQRKDGFTTTNDAVIATICYATIQASQWLQYLSMRRLLALSDRDCRATKRFLPLAAAGGLLMAWIHFGITFFDTSAEFKYLNMGFFQLGTPRVSISHSHHHDDETPEVTKRFQNGPNIATMMHAANVMYRKRMESDCEVRIS
ncbi:hypothetical protein OSTOST_20716 [Ostertagia ostertagi]